MRLRRIDEQVMVITGATSGIGLTTARMAAEQGAQLLLIARNEEALVQLCMEINAAGGRAVHYAADVADERSLRDAARRASEEFGRIDTWVNNAGVSVYGMVEDLSIEEIEQIIQVDLLGTIYGVKAALPVMRRQGGGTIINVSSVAGHKVRPGSAVYATTKAAVRMLSEGLRQEVKPHNIRTTIISPGAVRSELPQSITEADVAKGIQDFYAAYAIPADSFARMVAFAIGQPDEVDVNEILFRPTAQEL